MSVEFEKYRHLVLNTMAAICARVPGLKQSLPFLRVSDVATIGCFRLFHVSKPV